MSDLGYNLIHRFNIGDALRRSAARYPARRALHCAGRDVSYAELDALANRAARLLSDAGVRRGDAVGILSLNSPEYVALLFGCARIGAPLVPVNLMLTADDIDYLLEKTHVRVLLVDPALEGKLNREGAVVTRLGRRWSMDAALREELEALDGGAVEEFVESDDTATIVFTSGTTARPKGVVYTHGNWYAVLLSLFGDIGFRRDESCLLALPMFHVGGLAMTISTIAAGAEGIILPAIRVEAIAQAMREHKLTTMSLPATTWVGLLQTPGIESLDFSSLKKPLVFQYLPTPIFNRWRELVPHAEWINYFGQSETVSGASACGAELGGLLHAPDPIGTAHLPVEIRVVDDEMRDLPAGQVGEFVMRGPSITPGYFEDAAANEALFRGGWHHTGDMGYRDSNGCLYFVDRKKDMIKSGGENVSSQEVEEALSQHGDVVEVAVVGIADPYWIEKVVAAVVPAAGSQVTEEALIAFARSRLASFKAPKQVFLMRELPKNPTGKVLKRVLREQLEAVERQEAAAGRSTA